MKIHKLAIIALISCFTLQSAYSFSSCNEANEIKKELDAVTLELYEVEKKFSKSYMDESIGAELNMEIRSRLKNVDDQAEVAVLAEMLDEEASHLNSEQTDNLTAIGASTGALILSRILIKKINASPRKISIKAKLFKRTKVIDISGRKKLKLIRGGIHFLSFWSVIGEVYFTHQAYQNNKVRDLLIKMVDELNLMEQELAKNLLPKRRLAQELQVELDELEEEGLIAFANDKIICTH